MKKQIVIIHGASSFKTYEDYLTSLKNEEISLGALKSHKRWRDTLSLELGDGYEVLTPRIPNSTDARYKEWKIWFDKITEFIDDEVILIGHFMGGIFLAKYLSENILSSYRRSSISKR